MQREQAIALLLDHREPSLDQSKWEAHSAAFDQQGQQQGQRTQGELSPEPVDAGRFYGLSDSGSPKVCS